MSVLIQVSHSGHDALTSKCQRDSAEFAILMRGIIREHWTASHVEIRCELEEAKLLLALAIKVCPDSVPDIQKAIAGSAAELDPEFQKRTHIDET